MARIRRAICIAAAVCGLLSLVFAFGCERKKQESISVEKRRGVLGGQARHPETEKESMRTGDAEGIRWEGGITLSREPRLGEIVTATLKITPSEDVCDVKVSFGPLQGVEVVGGDTVAEAKHISKGGTKEFSIDVKFISSPARIGYNFDGQGVPAMTTIGGGCGLTRFIIDETNQFVPYEELSARRSELKFDPFGGERIEIMNPVAEGPWFWNGEVALSREPRLGDTVEVTFTVTAFSFSDLHEVKVIFCQLKGIEIVDGKTTFHVNTIRKGETRKFTVNARFFSAPATIAVSMPCDVLASVTSVRGYAILTRVIVDEETGQFGTEAVYRNSKLVFRYDHMNGKWLEQGEPGYEPFNREITKMMKRLEPALTDSEALCLHSEMYHVGWPPNVRAKWDKEKQKWIEDDIFLYYLKQGWLSAMREGRIEEWRAHLKARIRGEWEERKRGKKRDTGDENDQDETGFLMPDDPPEENALLGEPVPASKRFDGRWRSYKHLYDTSGLDTLTETRDIKSAEARVLVTYQYNDTLYRVYSPYATTDDTGGFFIQIDGMPPGALQHKAYAVIFPSGPNPGDPKIAVCDPNITILPYWKNPEDPDLFPCREDGIPPPHEFQPGLADTLHLETLFPGSYPAWPQPEAGAVNIYEALLQAYDYLVPTYTNPSAIGGVRALWEPGYVHQTEYIRDTIFVRGGVASVNTDEWDDDVLLHEYGHHVMYNLADRPPGAGGKHAWWHSYNWGLAYSEGWAQFFSSAVRNDPMKINTREGIGGLSARYVNLENPWSFSDSVRFSHLLTYPSWQGDECEATVAGALWDIYDDIQEPHDTLWMGFDEIWMVVTTDSALNRYCQHIFDFQAGWEFYGYDHNYALRAIYQKHRMGFFGGIRLPPIKVIGESKADRIDWTVLPPPGKDSTSLVNFRLYRSDVDIGPYTKIVSVDYVPGESLYSYTDSTVQYVMPYWYKVAAVNEAGFEHVSAPDSATP